MSGGVLSCHRVGYRSASSPNIRSLSPLSRGMGRERDNVFKQRYLHTKHLPDPRPC